MELLQMSKKERLFGTLRGRPCMWGCKPFNEHRGVNGYLNKDRKSFWTRSYPEGRYVTDQHGFYLFSLTKYP